MGAVRFITAVIAYCKPSSYEAFLPKYSPFVFLFKARKKAYSSRTLLSRIGGEGTEVYRNI